MKTPGVTNTAGIIKHVVDDISPENIEKDIKEQFPDAEVELFRRKSDGRFLGTVKVDFKDRTVLENAMARTGRVKIGRQKHLVEEYKKRTRVIKCNRCQAYGHIHRFCRAKEPKCGKCSETDHETMKCAKTSGFKCAHCSGNHVTASEACPVYKEKQALFMQANDDGY